MERRYPSDTMPFSSLEAYLEHRRRRGELEEQIKVLQKLNDLQEKDAGRMLLAHELEHMEEIRALARQRLAMSSEYADRLPVWLHSRCPFCGEPQYWKIDPFDLDGEWWFWPFVPREYKVPACPHLLCVDGVLNLADRQPTEVRRGRIRMASEVPFVKPRMLELGNVIAVIHRLPHKIAGQYTGYPIVYFGNPRPPLSEGSLGWARTEYHNKEGMWDIIYDIQDHDLDKWIVAQKVCWLDPHDPEHPLVNGPPEAYPFRDVRGHRGPYTVQDGQVWWSGYPTDGSKGGP